VVAKVLALGGDHDQALRELDAAIAAGKRGTDPSIELVTMHDQRGLLLTQTWQRFKDARRDHQAALALLDRLGIPEAERHEALFGLGLAELGLGRVGPALAHLERAHQVRSQGGVEPELRADSAFALARALTLAGRPRARACQLAQEALAPYREAGVERRKELEQLERWLDRQRCGTPGKPAASRTGRAVRRSSTR
jgi:tetratricopeptide (TPR) repeat protein